MKLARLLSLSRCYVSPSNRCNEEAKMVETGNSSGNEDSLFSSTKSVELLAAKNATLRLRAANGHVYSFTDLTSANGATNFGHLNPAFDLLDTLSSDFAPPFLPPTAQSYSQWLCRRLRLDDYSLHFRIGGQAALAAALRTAQQARPGKILTLQGSRHFALKDFPGNTVRIVPGDEFRDWDQISCLLYEPVQTANGYAALPLPWLRSLSRAAQSAGVCVIADEIECGFFRFGKLSLASSEFLRPDVYLFGNSISNGVYPLAVIVLPSAMNDHLVEDPDDDSLLVSTLGLRAAEQVAHYVDSNDMENLVVRIFAALSDSVERLAANPFLSAFNLAGPTLSFAVREARAAELVMACRSRGVLVTAAADGHRIKIAPPLTIPRDQLMNALKTLEQVAEMLPARTAPMQ
jgi:acetylornithine/succinyldiaminopimelate/putrescine aminotransferase